MPGAFFGLNIASNALRSFEAALNVTGHNLANVNTRGFSRQAIDITQTPSITFYGLRPFAMGSGAFAANVTRIRDLFLDGRYVQTSAEQARLGQMLTTMHEVESVFGEPGMAGIESSMSKMFDSWSALSTNPADEGARLNVRLQSGLFANRVREANNQMVNLQIQLDGEINVSINQINDLAAQISQLNNGIREQTAVGASPNDLLDQRQVLIERLSAMVDVRTQALPTGEMTVFVGQHTLVDQISYKPLPTSYDAATSTVFDANNSVTIKGGRLAGLLGSVNTINTYLAQLDTLVNEVRTNINAAHSSGINLNGTTGINIFTGTTGASDIGLDPAITSDIRNIAAGASGAPGDGGLATAIAQIRDTQYAALGNRSPIQYYTDLIGRLGQDTSTFDIALDTQRGILNQLDEQRASVSGVNIDEETANLMRYQRSYQAAAKLLTVLDQVTEDLIERFGR